MTVGVEVEHKLRKERKTLSTSNNDTERRDREFLVLSRIRSTGTAVYAVGTCRNDEIGEVQV